MSNIDVISNALEKEKIHRLSALKEHIELLLDILPSSVSIDISKREVLAYYFEPKSEEELLQMINYIAEYMNVMKINYNNIISMVYSQMEAAISSKVSEKNKTKEYNKYAKKTDGSLLKKMCDFITIEKIYTFDAFEVSLLNLIDDKIRNKRNTIMHDLYEFITTKEAIEFIGDGVNLNIKLHYYHNHCIGELNGIYIISNLFFDMCRRI